MRSLKVKRGNFGQNLIMNPEPYFFTYIHTHMIQPSIMVNVFMTFEAI